MCIFDKFATQMKKGDKTLQKKGKKSKDKQIVESLEKQKWRTEHQRIDEVWRGIINEKKVINVVVVEMGLSNR